MGLAIRMKVFNIIGSRLDDYQESINNKADRAAVMIGKHILREAENSAPKDTGNMSRSHYIIGRKHRFVNMPTFSDQGRNRKYRGASTKRSQEFSSAVSRGNTRFRQHLPKNQVGLAIIGFSASYARGMDRKKPFFTKSLMQISRFRRILRKSFRGR